MSILSISISAMLEPPPESDDSHDKTFAKLDALSASASEGTNSAFSHGEHVAAANVPSSIFGCAVPFDIFHFLANASSFSGEFTDFALPLVRSGSLGSLEHLRRMPDISVRKLGREVYMPPDSVERLLCAIRRSNSPHEPTNVERVPWTDPRFDKPKKLASSPVLQLMKIYDRLDSEKR